MNGLDCFPFRLTLQHFSLKVSKEKEKSSALGADLGHFFQALAENHYLESLDITYAALVCTMRRMRISFHSLLF